MAWRGAETQVDCRVDFYIEEFALSWAGNALIHPTVYSFTRSGCFEPSPGLGTGATEVGESLPPLALVIDGLKEDSPSSHKKGFQGVSASREGAGLELSFRKS